MADTRAISVQEAVDRIGFGRFQKRLLAVCGVTWAADAAEVLVLGFALPSIIGEFGITTTQGGLTVTATFAGMLVGAWFWGTISDYIGRRTGFQLTVLIFALFGLLSAFAPSWELLLILRFVTGFGLGGALPLDFSLYSEFLPTENRGRNLVIFESFWALGTIIAAGSRGSSCRASAGGRCSRRRRWRRPWCCGSGGASRNPRATWRSPEGEMRPGRSSPA
ncbi:MAG: MFS transporter [Actinomycetota bacterium]|nr:MFS transporter [Actinomycetota bacterium]